MRALGPQGRALSNDYSGAQNQALTGWQRELQWFSVNWNLLSFEEGTILSTEDHSMNSQRKHYSASEKVATWGDIAPVVGIRITNPAPWLVGQSGSPRRTHGGMATACGWRDAPEHLVGKGSVRTPVGVDIANKLRSSVTRRSVPRVLPSGWQSGEVAGWRGVTWLYTASYSASA